MQKLAILFMISMGTLMSQISWASGEKLKEVDYILCDMHSLATGRVNIYEISTEGEPYYVYSRRVIWRYQPSTDQIDHDKWWAAGRDNRNPQDRLATKEEAKKKAIKVCHDDFDSNAPDKDGDSD